MRNQGRDIQINQSLDQDKFIRSNTKNTVDELRSQLGLNNRDRSIRANDAISNRDFNNAERASQIDELRNSLQIDAASRQNQTGSIQERVASQLAMSANEREQLDNELDNIVGNTRRDLQQKEATTAFDMQARQIEGLIAAGEQSATGRRGKSQAQNIGSVLAEVGRSQAQLSDSIRRSRTQS